MIDQSTINKILDSAEIVDVVQDYVTLKKRGVNLLGLCPFHNEKTPSFTVSPSKGIYKCFGCGKGGNSVNFLMEHEHLSYPDALRYLARKYHIEIIEKELTPEEVKQQNERESIIVALSFAQKSFSEQLFQHDEGITVGLSYFKERGFRQDTLKKFGVGYALMERDAFTKMALSAAYRLDMLEKAGLTIIRENNNTDRFFGRIIFPIQSISGQILGFGGRLLRSDAKAAKYINSPETPVYQKSRALYGIFQAKQSIVANNKCYLVEGYTDVLALHQSGIENVVASSGTALSVDQIRIIKRFSENITILFDGDEAGLKASIRGLDLILEEGLNVKVVVLPEGEDPDSYSKKLSATEYQEYIQEHEKDFIRFKTELLMLEARNDPVQKANLIRDIVRSISVIPDSINRAVYLRECSSLLNVDEKILYHETNTFRRKIAEQNYKKLKSYDIKAQKLSPRPDTPTIDDSENQERELIRLMLNYGNHKVFSVSKPDDKDEEISVVEYIIAEITTDDLSLENPVYQQIMDEFVYHLNKEKILDHKYFINHPDVKISQISSELMAPGYGLSKIWKKHENYIETEEMRLKEVVFETLNAFKNKKVLFASKKLQVQLLEAQERKDLEEIDLLQEKIMVLNNLKRELSRNLGDRTII